MKKMESLERVLGRVDPHLLAWAYRHLKRIPAVRRRIDKEYDGVMAEMEASVKPYRQRFAVHERLPGEGLERGAILREMEELRELERARWQDGFVSGAVYHGDEEHIRFLDRVYALNSQSNPLHSDLWPSTTRYEAEVVSMTARMLGADGTDDEICGTVSSGGTESILLAMKVYRDRARAERGVRKPEMVVPTSVHAAFDKAGQYFGIRLRRVPVGPDYRADVGAMTRAVNRNTVVVVGSAPCFPHGVIDPIGELSDMARRRGVGFHTDACLGGFVLPWAEKLGYPVPPFDFRLPGVTSMSADTHKYGYAAKGTSVVLYRHPDLRRYQYFTATDWSGGLYASPTMGGSKAGGLIAVAWAVMVKLGQEGYLDAARRILEAGDQIREGIESIPGLHVLGNPLWVISFASNEVDIFQVLDAMAGRGWSLNGLQFPPAVHIAVTLRHTQPGVVERFLSDLAETVEEVRTQPAKSGGMAPIYGMAASVPFRGMVDDILRGYLDLLYKVGRPGDR